MSKKLNIEAEAPDAVELEEPAAGLESTDCEICGERLGARAVWRKGVYYGWLCPDCERDGRRGVSRSRPRS